MFKITDRMIEIRREENMTALKVQQLTEEDAWRLALEFRCKYLSGILESLLNQSTGLYAIAGFKDQKSAITSGITRDYEKYTEELNILQKGLAIGESSVRAIEDWAIDNQAIVDIAVTFRIDFLRAVIQDINKRIKDLVDLVGADISDSDIVRSYVEIMEAHEKEIELLKVDIAEIDALDCV